MSIYLIKITVSLSLCYLLYRWILEGQKTYRFNRFYLLLSLGICLTVPLLSIETNDLNTLYQTYLIEVSDVVLKTDYPTENTSHSLWSFTTMAYVLYLIGFFWHATHYVRGLYRLLKLRNHGISKIFNQHQFIVSPHVPHAFTFGRTIYVPTNTTFDSANAILTHECAHAQQWHTADLVAIEWIRCVFWFHPLFYFYKKAIVLNHEFLADDAALKTSASKQAYLNLLLTKTYESNEILLTSSFNYNLTKKRFIMITKKNKPFKNACSMIVASTVLSLAALCSTQAQEKNEPITATILVDQHAMYPDGMRAFQEYFISSLSLDSKSLPEDHDQETAKVILQFFVDTDGSLVDIEVLRSELNEENTAKMIQVLRNSKKWNPAMLDHKAIKSQFTLPITIRIEDEKPVS